MKKTLFAIILLVVFFVLTMMPITAEAGAPSFKAVYDTTDGKNILYFYYDDVSYSGENKTEYTSLPTAANSKDAWGYGEIREEVKSVVINESVKNYTGLTSTSYMFYGMKNATNISGAENLNVSNVTRMNFMFAYFGERVEGFNVVPDVSEWDTSKVTGTKAMFRNYGYHSDMLDKVPDVSKWNTESLGTASLMFREYGNYSKMINTVPDVSKWNTKNLTSTEEMFYSFGACSTELNVVPDVSNWNTENLENIIKMFFRFGLSSTKLNAVPDVSKWNTSKIGSINNFVGFYGMNSTVLEFVMDFSNWKLPAYNYDSSLFDDNTAKNAQKWIVKIPGQAGEEPNVRINTTTTWNVGSNNATITPPSSREFSLSKTITNEVPISANNTNKGYINVSAESWPGEIVTITVVPNAEYTLKDNSLKALYNDGVDKSCTLTQDATDKTKYTFTMPAYEVTVSAEFVSMPRVNDIFEDNGIKYSVTSVGTTNTVKVIPDGYSAKSITIPEKTTYHSTEFTVTGIEGYAFRYCSSLEEISLPDSITNIGEFAFSACSDLENIKLPENLTSIGNAAFQNCVGFVNITIPANVNSIGSNVFYGDTNLATINMLGTVPPTLNPDAFTDSVTSIIVPKSALVTYREAARWSNYPDRLKAYFSVDASSLTNGTVTIDKNVLSGETATLKVVPAENYQLKADSLKVIYNTDKSIVPEATQTEGEYSFVMPGYDVKITAEFEEKTHDFIITATSDKSVYDEGETIKITGTLKDSTTPVNNEDVTVFITETKKYDLITNEDGSFNVDINGLLAGKYLIRVWYEKDKYEDEVIVTVKEQNPEPDITVTASSDKDTYLEGESITVTATVLDGNTPVDNEIVVFSANGEKYRLTTINGSCSVSIYLPAGSYIISVFYEKNGDEYKDEVEVTVSEQPNVNHIVKFDLNNGNTNGPEMQTIEEGKKATKPADPSDEGWIFEGWYSDAELTTEYDFSAPIMADIKLFAKWTEEGLPIPPEPEPKPVEVYYAPLVADLKANEGGVIEWKAGDSLPLEAVRLLVEKPELSLEFTFTYEGEEHTIFIPAGAFEKYYDVTIPWYGPAWLIQYFEKPEKDVIEYIIMKDDTLNALAEKFKCTVEEILALNPFITNPNKIYTNNKILISVQK